MDGIPRTSAIQALASPWEVLAILLTDLFSAALVAISSAVGLLVIFGLAIYGFVIVLAGEPMLGRPVLGA